jgi:putative tricarboxylic transport membrane protein
VCRKKADLDCRHPSGGSLVQIQLRSSQDFWSGALFIGIALFMLVAGLDLAVGTSLRMGAGYVPRLLCSLLLVIGIALVGRGLLVTGADTGTWNLRPMIFVLGSILLFAFALERLGLVLTTFLVVGVSSFSIRDFRPKELLVVASVMSIACSGIFVFGLKLIIPLWPQL